MVAGCLLYLQMHNGSIVNLQPSFSSFPLIVNAVVMGIIFSFIGCPGCYLGLFFSLGIYEKKPLRHSIFALVIFSLTRMLTIFLYAFFGQWVFQSIVVSARFQLVFFIEAGIMIFFGVLIAKPPLFHTLRMFTFSPRISYLLYAFWGAIFGLPCAVESSGFLSYLWFYPADFFPKSISFFLFAVFSTISLIIFVIIFFAGISGFQRIFKNISIYFRRTAVFYLISTGIFFFFYALKGV